MITEVNIKDYSYVHVYPTNDLKPHSVDGKTCKCKPYLEVHEGEKGIVVVHNSYDGREFFEGKGH